MKQESMEARMMQAGKEEVGVANLEIVGVVHDNARQPRSKVGVANLRNVVRCWRQRQDALEAKLALPT